MPRKSIAEGKVNVDKLVRGILGFEPSCTVSFKNLSKENKRMYWAVANVFRRNAQFLSQSRGNGYKTGLGMKKIAEFVEKHIENDKA